MSTRTTRKEKAVPSNWPDRDMAPDSKAPHVSTCNDCGAAISDRAKHCNHCGRLLGDPTDPREHELFGDGRGGDRLRSLDIFRAALMDAKKDQGLMLDGRRWCASPEREDDQDDTEAHQGGEAAE